MAKKATKILAIETSCDETAAAVISTNNLQLTTNNITTNKLSVGSCQLSVNILSNVVSSQIDLHKQYGGVFPEVASRAHTERIIPVVTEALHRANKSEGMPLSEVAASRTQSETGMGWVPESERATLDLICDIDVIAVTVGPGLIGSLLVGVNFAKTLAYATGKPIIGINHWLGHIYSCFAKEKQELRTENLLDPNKLLNYDLSSKTSVLPQFPILALIVSGGHTGLVLMKSHRDIQPLGETLDDAAGEAFDKVASLLRLSYPGGPSISKAAAGISKSEVQISNKIKNIKFPRSMLDRKDYNFSFSGLKTAVLYKVKELQSQGITLNHYQSPIAFEFQQAVIDILIGKTLQAAREFKPKSIILCGGVSANKELREQMEKAIQNLELRTENLGVKRIISKHYDLRSKISFHCPPMDLSTDNAAMIGLAAAYQLTTNNKQLTTWDKITAQANLKL